MIKNKRGFLLGEETVKLIIAVISILFLILFIIFLYNNFTKSKELDEAKSSLDYLTEQIKSGSSTAELFNPKEWAIVSFSLEEGNLPDKCSKVGWESCLCICNPAKGNINSRLACNLEGTCSENDFRITGDSDILLSAVGIKLELDGIIITPPLTVSINQEGKTIVRAE